MQDSDEVNRLKFRIERARREAAAHRERFDETEALWWDKRAAQPSHNPAPEKCTMNQKAARYVALAREAHAQARIFERQRMPFMSNHWAMQRRVYLELAREALGPRPTRVSVVSKPGDRDLSPWQPGKEVLTVFELAESAHFDQTKITCTMALAAGCALVADAAIRRAMGATA